MGLSIAGLGCSATTDGADELGASQHGLTATNWSGWSSVPGGTGSSAPAVSSLGSASLDIYVKGADDDGIWRDRYGIGIGWAPWELLGAVATSKPSVTMIGEWPAVAVRGTDNRIWVRIAADPGGTEWQAVSGSAASDAPALVYSEATRTFFLFIRSGQRLKFATNKVVSESYDHLNWTAFSNLPDGVVTSAPAATASWFLGATASSRLVVVTRSQNRRFRWTESLDSGNSWRAWNDIPAEIFATFPDPAVVDESPNGDSVHVFGTRDDGAIVVTTRTGSSTAGYRWSPYTAVGDRQFTSSPGAVDVSDRIWLVGRGTRNDYWFNRYRE